LARRFALALAAAWLLGAPTPAAHAQGTPVPTVDVQGVSVYVAQYGWTYNSSLTTTSILLQDGSRAELWMFEGVADECTEIIMRSSEIDAYLVLRQNAPFGETIAEDDDSGGGSDAGIHVRLPATDTYFITATSAGSGQELGRYTLDLDRCG
jgi:hypothetical protein